MQHWNIIYPLLCRAEEQNFWDDKDAMQQNASEQDVTGSVRPHVEV